jgi:hypothetical protein
VANYKGKGLAATVRILERIAKKQEKMLVEIQSGFPRVMFQAGTIVQARAQEIITEKGHVVTGNLKRSIHTVVEIRSRTRVAAIVGTFVEYAPFVEALPDGGFMFEAAVQTSQQVVRYLYEHGIRPAEQRLGTA